MEAFSLFDQKSKGIIKADDIKNVFNQFIDIEVTDQDIEEFLRDYDEDKDGGLSFKEFSNM